MSEVDSGIRKIDWAREHMPILERVAQKFEDQQPLSGYTIGMAMHVEAKTAVLAETLASGGAEVAITGCNPLSTQNDVSQALDGISGVRCYAEHGVEREEYYEAIDNVISHDPEITVDDGGDLVFRIHEKHPELIDTVIGGCEETTTGVHRLRAMERDGELRYPMIAVNDTPMKRFFDNVHGTGESSLSSIMITSNLLISGKTVVIAGYGYCGRGLASKADGLGANIVVTEVDPRRALEAHMDGYRVMSMSEAAEIGDLFITSTGNRDVIEKKHFRSMKDGAVLANAGHFDIEIDIDGLEELADEVSEVRDGINEYRLPDERRINILASGRLVNLASPESMGHPVEVMDQSFGVQALCVEELLNKDFKPGLHQVPDDIDREVAEIKLDALDIEIDELSDEQERYMSSWDHGT